MPNQSFCLCIETYIYYGKILTTGILYSLMKQSLKKNYPQNEKKSKKVISQSSWKKSLIFFFKAYKKYHETTFYFTLPFLLSGIYALSISHNNKEAVLRTILLVKKI